jgi:3-hydroxyacyl-[acyl-carrier-protein] dehydratase
MTLNHEQIQEIIPHRSPMLLIDEVDDIVPGECVTAHFYVDAEREIFKGHFPQEPILPGVYTVESTAQAADLLLMTKPCYAGKIPLLLGIDHVAFKKAIHPGDTIKICSKLKNERADKAIGTCEAIVYLGDEVAAETKVTIALR